MAIGLILAATQAGSAATVFFYSDPEPYYGWAAGYNYNLSESYAHEECKSAGGSECKFVLECDGGWAGVAFADNMAKGVSFACGLDSAFGAFTIALATCVAKAKTLCWTYSTISGTGRLLSTEQNYTRDRTYYTQLMLATMGFDPGKVDGQIGGKTRSALKAFQAKLGLAQTGELDDAVFNRLLDALGGRPLLVKQMQEQVDQRPDVVAEFTYSYSARPYDVASFSQEVATRSEEERRMTLATLMTMWGTPCTLPAKRAEPQPPDGSGGWLVTCEEGDWTVIWIGGIRVVKPGLHTITVTRKDAGDAGDAQPVQGK